ncbi:helix-turn-helix domain-containing protein [Streptomyces bambusae]|uniref:helix-turn-helix domain-containing protein n=1 Tax=Streptomyces bambusae TaxID=1550616 RepID=UPI001CFD2558|nr:helix-turn-helix domain-containing protein [Streptomyces bambusae]MCB5168058.1 helix-turn-helix domain-containing protein [Streptomyces bambusae]
MDAAPCVHASYGADMRSGEETVRQRFGALIADAVQRAGRYEGRGGQALLAQEIGLSPSAVGRMLRGETLPDPRHFEAIARVLNLDVQELLVEAGILSPESLSTPSQNRATGVGSDSITLGQAAAALGITSAVGREMFIAAVERLQRTERDMEAEGDGGGGTAAHA